jgi:hypothetical protein
VGGAVAPAVPEAIDDPAIGGLGEAVGGDRRPRHVSAQPFQSAPIARRHTDVRVEAEALDARAARTGDRLYLTDVDAVAQP